MLDASNLKTHIVHRMRFSGSQQRKVNAFLARSGRIRHAIHAHLRALYQELGSQYNKYKFDPQRARPLQEEIVAQHQRLFTVYDDNETEIRHLLTRGQFEDWRTRTRAERERHRIEQ